MEKYCIFDLYKPLKLNNMKKIYSLIFASALTLISLNLSAVNIAVSVTNNAFSPTNFNAVVGDVITWTWNSSGMTHNVTGQQIPAGAAAISSGNMSSGTYTYTITTAGNYGYSCTIHALSGMVGGFAVSTTTGISAPSTNLLTTAYPNPCNDKLTIKCSGIESIDVFNLIGEKVKTVELAATESKIEIDFSNLPSGMYFYRAYKDGIIVETKRIVKSK